MAQATFSVRMEKNLKEKFAEVCESIGMNMSTAINVFANAVVDKRKIPFEIEVPSNDNAKFMETINTMRNIIKKTTLKNYHLMKSIQLSKIQGKKETKNDWGFD